MGLGQTNRSAWQLLLHMLQHVDVEPCIDYVWSSLGASMCEHLAPQRNVALLVLVYLVQGLTDLTRNQASFRVKFVEKW